MSTLDPGMPGRVRAAAQQLLSVARIPGLSVGVVDDTGLVFCEAFGYADIESGEPMDPERRQRIASITKTMVGLCVMGLVDDGMLSLDDRLTKLLPDVAFIGPADGITIKHLLTHTSGIGEAPTMERLRDAANPDRESVGHPGDFSGMYPEGVIVEVDPGSKWAYCNNGYALLGEIIVRTAGAPLQDVMHERIWRPLGMTSTDILDANDDRISTCYHRAPNDDTRFQLQRAGIAMRDEATVDGLNIRGKFTPDFNMAMRAAGGVQSTIPDMARYASALLKQGAGIVREETFRDMISPVVGSDARMTSWGLSFARTPLRTTTERPSSWRTTIGHGGAYFGGWNSHLDILPELGVGIVQHMNIMLDEPAPLFRAIVRAVLNVESGPVPERRSDAALLAAAPGLYELPMPGPLTNFRPQTRTGRVNITREGNDLLVESRWGKWKAPVRLVSCDPDDPAFFTVPVEAAAPAYVAFDVDPSGQVRGLRLDDLVYMHRRQD